MAESTLLASTHPPRNTWDFSPISVSLNELAADQAIRKGHFKEARESLLSALDHSYTDVPRPFGRLALKYISLPFHEIAELGPSPELIEECEAVYGYAGELLKFHLDELSQSPRYDSRNRTIGDISETTFMALFCRQFGEDTTQVVAASSMHDDHHDRSPTDFLVLSIPKRKGSTKGATKRVQIKTSLAKERKINKKTISVPTLGFDQINTRKKDHPLTYDSIAQSIIRELAGKATDADTLRLDAAVKKAKVILDI